MAKESTKHKTQWYAVHTYSGREGAIKINLEKRIKSFNLEDQFDEILIPTQDKIEIKDGEKKTVKERIFPGYLLIKMDLTDKTWSTVRETPGIIGFVGKGTEPTPLEPEEVKKTIELTQKKAPTFKTKFSVGEAIKIIDGPFADFIGTIDQLDEEKGKLKALVSIFGRETPVELDFNQVSKM